MEKHQIDTTHGSRSERNPDHGTKKPEKWSTQEDSLRHTNKTVTVFDAETGRKILTGKVVGYTDLLGSGGILAPDLKNVQAAIRFPHDPERFKEEMSKYQFRVED